MVIEVDYWTGISSSRIVNY